MCPRLRSCNNCWRERPGACPPPHPSTSEYKLCLCLIISAALGGVPFSCQPPRVRKMRFNYTQLLGAGLPSVPVCTSPHPRLCHLPLMQCGSSRPWGPRRGPPRGKGGQAGPGRWGGLAWGHTASLGQLSWWGPSSRSSRLWLGPALSLAGINPRPRVGGDTRGGGRQTQVQCCASCRPTPSCDEFSLLLPAHRWEN